MKPQKSHIDKEFAKWKQNYKVPEGYFEQFVASQTKQVPVPFYKRKSNWAWAATLLLLITLGYNILHQNGKKPLQKIKGTSENQVVQMNQLFDDLTDDEIIEYFTEEDVYIDDEFEN